MMPYLMHHAWQVRRDTFFPSPEKTVVTARLGYLGPASDHFDPPLYYTIQVIVIRVVRAVARGHDPYLPSDNY